MDVLPLTGVLGAEITGIDLASDLSDQQVAELRAAMCEHQVVIIPDQDLDPAAQSRFSRRVGPPGPTNFVDPMDDHPDVILVLKEVDEADAFNFGGAWHSDWSFQSEPPSFTILHAIDVPPYGGDTIWSSMVAAAELLDDDTRAALAGVTAVHTARDAYSPKMAAIHDSLKHMSIRTDESANAEHRHPLLCTHPETGRELLFFNSAYVRDLDGTDEAESLLRRLHALTTDIRITVRHRWHNGDVAIWDNRSTQHLALNDYGGFRRQLHRTTVAGTAPTL